MENDYKNSRHVSRNGLILGLSAGGIGAIILGIVHIIHSISSINEGLKENEFKNAGLYFVTTDSAGKKDTIRLEEYLKQMKEQDSLANKYEIPK
jgi:hypothetical protein